MNTGMDAIPFATPRRRVTVRQIADKFLERHAPATKAGAMMLPLVNLVDSALLNELTGFQLAIVNDSVIGENVFGELADGEFRITNSVYHGIMVNDPPSRLVVVHELGHALLHADIVNTPKSELVYGSPDTIPFAVNPEAQADYFALYALMPPIAVRQLVDAFTNEVAPTPVLARDFSIKYGVPYSAVVERLHELQRELSEVEASHATPATLKGVA